MSSVKIPINFVTSNSYDPPPDQECIQKDLGYYFNNFWHLRISKVPRKKKCIPFLIIKRNKHVPNLRIRFQLQVINLDTKEEYRRVGEGQCKKSASFKLNNPKMFSGGNTLCIKGELELHLKQFTQILPSPPTLITLSGDFKKLFCNPKFSDVDLKCGSDTFPAHKNILTARCLFFAEKLLNTPNESELLIDDLDPNVLRAVLSYIYSGKTEHFTFETACELLSAANKYRINDLKATCADFIKHSFSLENVFDLYNKFEVARCYALEFIAKNIEFLENSEQWKAFKYEKPDLATVKYLNENN